MKVPLLDLKKQYFSLKEEIDLALQEIIESQYFILGPVVEEFEHKFASYCGAKHAVGCSSGSDAILLSLMAMDVGPGDFVLYLWDNRSFSESYGVKQEVTVGETNNVSVLVPPGVVHGYKSITKTGSFSINLPDKLYAGVDRKEEVDEIRHENMSSSKFKID